MQMKVWKTYHVHFVKTLHQPEFLFLEDNTGDEYE